MRRLILDDFNFLGKSKHETAITGWGRSKAPGFYGGRTLGTEVPTSGSVFFYSPWNEMSPRRADM